MNLFLCLNTLLMLTMPVFGGDLKVAYSGKTNIYSSQKLYDNPNSLYKTIPILNYPDSRLKMRMLPLEELFAGQDLRGRKLKFSCLDGYSGVLDLTKALDSGSKAFVAIESKESPWPHLPKKSQKKPMSAGPFYLVWDKPKAGQVPPEYWPYQLKSLELLPLSQKPFAKIAPLKNLTADDPAHKGFDIFVARCAPCHKMDGHGTSDIGPDLNRPMNPTEYFKADALKEFIRDPSSVREWNDMKMKWVAEDSWSEGDIDQLIAYLSHMAKRK